VCFSPLGATLRFLFLLCVLLAFCGFGSVRDSYAAERLIAVIVANDLPRYHLVHQPFVDALREFCPDQSCRVYVQTPNADVMSLRNSARKSVAVGADLIVAYGASAALAARQESGDVPVLFADVYNPKAYDRPSLRGDGVGGIRGDAPLQTLMKRFSESVHVDSLAIVYEEINPEGRQQYRDLRDFCERKSIALSAIKIKKDSSLKERLDVLPQMLDGVFLANQGLVESFADEVFLFAEQRKIPVVTQAWGMEERGAFMVMNASPEEQGVELASLAQQLLAGELNGEIPIYKPRQIGFVVNMDIAHRFNIKVPLDTLAVSSRIIR